MIIQVSMWVGFFVIDIRCNVFVFVKNYPDVKKVKGFQVVMMRSSFLHCKFN